MWYFEGTYARNIGPVPFLQPLIVREKGVCLRHITSCPGKFQCQFLYSVTVFNSGFGCPSIGKDITALFKGDGVATVAQYDFASLQTIKNFRCLK